MNHEICAKNAELIYKDGSNIVRMYDERAQHVASLLPCGANEDGTIYAWDLATPDGKVLWCGIENDLVDVFANQFGWQKLEWNN